MERGRFLFVAVPPPGILARLNGVDREVSFFFSFLLLYLSIAPLMPIQIKCACGKPLAVKDEFAGKTVKCPGCGQGVPVPSGAGPAQAQAYQVAPAAQPVQQAATATGGLDDLFDEEGFEHNVTAVCPSCRAVMGEHDVLCTKCGYNTMTGQVVQRHLSPGMDLDASEMMLRKAESDMEHADKLQRDMVAKSGMPWWMLGLILFVLCSATGIAVLAVNAANRVDDIGFNPMQMFLQLAGGACAMVAIGATLSLIYKAFQEDQKQGFLSLTILYLFVFVFKKPKGRIGALIVAIVVGGAAAGLFVAASNQ